MLECLRARKGCNNSKNALHPKPSPIADCKAKVNAIACPDGMYKLSNAIFEHAPSPRKTWYYE